MCSLLCKWWSLAKHQPTSSNNLVSHLSIPDICHFFSMQFLVKFFSTQKCVNQDKVDCATNNKIAKPITRLNCINYTYMLWHYPHNIHTRCGEISDVYTSVMWWNLKLLNMWRNFRFLHIWGNLLRSVPFLMAGHLNIKMSFLHCEGMTFFCRCCA